MPRLEYNSRQELCFDGHRLLDHVQEGPTYFYSKKCLLDRWQQYSSGLRAALPNRDISIHYALKANSNPDILQFFLKQGAGVDVVSAGEMKKALAVGLPAKKIVFSGVGKTEQEIRFAIDQGIEQLNVESSSELRRISRIAQQEVAIALRINPHVNPMTHPYISTGFKENKFGIDPDQLSECLDILKASPRLKLQALTLHIGSQLLDFSALNEAIEKTKKLVMDLRGQGFPVQKLDVGGGVGIRYEQDAEADAEIFRAYAQVLQKQLQDFPAEIQFEPGRFLVARAGVLLAQVQYVKNTAHKNFLILNSGMNHLLRPALYEAFHRTFPLLKREGKEVLVDVVGPVCESADFLAKSRILSPVHELDHLCIADVGAYGFSMASGYNSFEFPNEVIL